MRADLGDAQDNKEMAVAGLESGITTILVRPEDDVISSLGRIEALRVDSGQIMRDGKVIGAMVTVASPDDQEDAVTKAGGLEFLIVGCGDWKVIPLENLIADLQKTETSLMAVATSPEEAALFSETLEVGVDGIVIQVDDPAKVRAFMDSIVTDILVIEEVTVTAVRNLPLGDRVCVDTTTMMAPGEGMLVGSHAGCLLLVQSESEDSGYVASRPFRVNAGAVHSYVMVPGGRTRYLSELKAGDEALVVGRDGATRSASVGRAKVERRPLMLVDVEHQDGRNSVVVQNAETIRLCTKEGSISVTELKPGDRILAHMTHGGRHFGRPVQETVREI